MAKDYAKQKKSNSRGRKSSKNSRSAAKAQRRGVPGWFWLLTGLSLGLFIAGLVYLKEYQGTPVSQFVSKHFAKKTTKKAEKPKKSIKKAEHNKPQFDFYKILPNMTVSVPSEQKSKQVEKAPPALPEKKMLAQNYVLQVASFQNYQDADKLKAELTLRGFDVSIYKIKTHGKTWNRVLIGPFKQSAQAQKVQNALTQQKIKSILLKMDA